MSRTFLCTLAVAGVFAVAQPLAWPCTVDDCPDGYNIIVADDPDAIGVTLTGTAGNDCIIGGDGPDTISGGGGDDYICGGDGDDTINGGPGNDFIDGGAGNDTLHGGPGADEIRGGEGDDTINGGNGDDIIDGGPGNDNLSGGNGNDRITGGTGDDTIDGGTGNDECAGSGSARPPTGCEVFTYALVTAFSALGNGDQVIVSWSTSGEAGTIGFVLERLDPGTGRFQPLHSGLLAALHTAPQGGTYQFVDPTAVPGQKYVYLLTEIDSGQGRTSYGPYAVTAQPTVPWPALASARDPYVSLARKTTARHIAPVGHLAYHPGVRRDAPAAIKIAVDAPGLYRLGRTQIAELLNLSSNSVGQRIRSRGFALSYRDQPVAWYPDAQGDGLVFYGEPEDSIYSRARVYVLRPGIGVNMTAQAVATPATLPDLSFAHTAHAEQDIFPGIVAAPDPDSDYWFWKVISATSTASTASVAVDLPGLAPVSHTAIIAIRVHGASTTGQPGEHLVAIRANGVEVGSFQFDGLTAHEAVLPVSASALVDGSNRIDLVSSAGNGAGYSIVYVDSVDVTYERRYRADSSDSLWFRADSPAAVAIDGFSTPALSVFDITDPLRPVALAQVAVEPTGSGDYRLGFLPQPGDLYLALPAAATSPPAAVWPDWPSGLRAPTHNESYVLITTAALRAEAEVLAAHRRRQGLGVLVVDIEDIYDEFNGAQPSPYAIRDFLAFARAAWRVAPRYVLLAGLGTFDYRNNMAIGDNLLPPLMVRTRAGLFASDYLLSDLDGDGGPADLALGRLPVITSDQLRAVVSKIIAYENQGAGPWTNRMLLLADLPEERVDFPSGSDAAAALLPSWFERTRIYLSELSVADARAALFEQLDSGAAFVNYFGHGGLDRMANDGLLRVQDVQSLNNQVLPVITALTCTISRFEIPGFVSLGESLVTRSGGGAIAVWAPSGLATAQDAETLQALVFERAFSAPNRRLGDLLRDATRAYHDSGAGPELIEIYQLLGDPALQVKLAAHPTTLAGAEPQQTGPVDNPELANPNGGGCACAVSWRSSAPGAPGVFLAPWGLMALLGLRRARRRPLPR
jgi:hypothetical protein